MIFISILSPIICASITLVGVIITNKKSTALTNYKVEKLIDEIKKINNETNKIPLIELKIKNIPCMEKQIQENKTNITLLMNKGVNKYDTQ